MSVMLLSRSLRQRPARAEAALAAPRASVSRRDRLQRSRAGDVWRVRYFLGFVWRVTARYCTACRTCARPITRGVTSRCASIQLTVALVISLVASWIRLGVAVDSGARCVDVQLCRQRAQRALGQPASSSFSSSFAAVQRVAEVMSCFALRE